MFTVRYHTVILQKFVLFLKKKQERNETKRKYCRIIEMRKKAINIITISKVNEHIKGQCKMCLILKKNNKATTKTKQTKKAENIVE